MGFLRKAFKGVADAGADISGQHITGLIEERKQKRFAAIQHTNRMKEQEQSQTARAAQQTEFLASADERSRLERISREESTSRRIASDVALSGDRTAAGIALEGQRTAASIALEETRSTNRIELKKLGDGSFQAEGFDGTFHPRTIKKTRMVKDTLSGEMVEESYDVDIMQNEFGEMLEEKDGAWVAASRPPYSIDQSMDLQQNAEAMVAHHKDTLGDKGMTVDDAKEILLMMQPDLDKTKSDTSPGEGGLFSQATSGALGRATSVVTEPLRKAGSAISSAYNRGRGSRQAPANR